MKKLSKLLVVSAILTMLFAVPVMAEDCSFSSENTDALITLLNNNAAKMTGDLNNFIKVQCGPNAQAIIDGQTALVNNKIAAINKASATNHIQMLAGKVQNAKFIENTRLQQLNSFKALAAGSSTWNDEVAAAQKEYDAAVARTAAAEQYLADAKVKLASFL